MPLSIMYDKINVENFTILKEKIYNRNSTTKYCKDKRKKKRYLYLL